MLHGENVPKSALMTASVTDLRRKTSDLIDAVKRGESVHIEAHGRPVATLEPGMRTISFGQIAEMMERFGGDPETADAIEAEIKKARKERIDAGLD